MAPPPPPVAPSPHRFLAKSKQNHKPLATNKPAETSIAKPKAKASATPASYSKRQAGPSTTTPAQQPSRAQFASTPRFNFARPPSPKRQRLNHVTAPVTQTDEHFITPRRPRFLVSSDDAIIERELPNHHQHEADSDDEADEEQKSADESVRSHHNQPGKPPPFVPNHHPAHGAQDIQSQIQDLPSPPLLAHRPVFLHAPASPDAARRRLEPLPEAFSPHRRGQKFIPGGMASSARQWILDAAQHTRRGVDDAWRVRVVESVGAAGGNGGVLLVKGRIEGGGGDREVRMVLPGAGKHIGSLTVGAILSVRPPVWEVSLGEDIGGQGGLWTVAADWQVLRENS